MQHFLSPKELSEATGVSESTLKRWVDAGNIQAVKTAGGHRRIPLSEAMRFIRDTGHPLPKPEALGLGELNRVTNGASVKSHPHEFLMEALLAGDGESVRGLVLSRYLAGQSVAAICDNEIRFALSSIGAIWCHDPAGVFYEHRATDLCIQVLSYLRSVLPDPPPNAPLAVGGATTGDPYIIPSLMVAASLMDAGWEVHNLGPDCPVSSLWDAATLHNADLVWISVSRHDVPEEFSDEVCKFAKRLASSGIRLVLGGRMLPDKEGLPCESVEVGSSMADLVGIAHRLVPSNLSKAVKEEGASSAGSLQ